MSLDAIRWALDQPVKSSRKLLLVALGDCVNSDGGDAVCWPSQAFLAHRTGQDTKTIEAGLRSLREEGYIEDSGQRSGRTGAVIVYRLNTTKNGGASDAQSTPKNGVAEPGSTPKNGPYFEREAPPKTGQLELGSTPVFPASTPVFPEKHPRFSGEAPPKTGDGSSNGTSNGTSKGTKERERACAQPPDVTDQTWTDWTALRKKKRTTVNQTVVEEARREASKAGLSLERFLQVWCLRGSQGLQADWLKPNERGNGYANGHAGGNKHRGFDHVDYEEGLTNGVPDA